MTKKIATVAAVNKELSMLYQAVGQMHSAICPKSIVTGTDIPHMAEEAANTAFFIRGQLLGYELRVQDLEKQIAWYKQELETLRSGKTDEKPPA